MNIQQARQALAALEAGMGKNATVFVSVSLTDASAIRCSLYPQGMSKSVCFTVKANDWDELVSLAQAEWAKRSDQNAENITQALALKIIELTHLHGECTDSFLRAEFDAGDIAKHGDAAVERANEMADRGPFTITIMSGANERAAA